MPGERRNKHTGNHKFRCSQIQQDARIHKKANTCWQLTHQKEGFPQLDYFQQHLQQGCSEISLLPVFTTLLSVNYAFATDLLQIQSKRGPTSYDFKDLLCLELSRMTAVIILKLSRVISARRLQVIVIWNTECKLLEETQILKIFIIYTS